MATLSPSDARENTVTLASTTAGPINVGFRLFSEDILVYVDDVETTAFTLTATFEDGFEDDATITFDTAQDAGSVVTIQSNFQPERGSDYLPNDAQLTANLNIELGHLWGVNADVRRDYDRFLKLPPGSTSSTVLPSPVANTRFGFDADGNPTLFAGAGSADVSTAMEPVVGAATLGAALTQLGITAFIQTLLDDADAATARATLGLVLGTNVQAYNALLADIAGLTLSAGDLLYFDGSNIVNLGKGTAGQVLKQGASAPQWAAAGFTFISSTTLSNDATADFTGLDDANYSGFAFKLSNVIPATDNVALWLRVSDDGGVSFDAGASDYRWSAQVQGTGSSDQYATHISVNGQVGIGSNSFERGVSGWVYVHNPNDFQKTHVTALLGFQTSAGGDYSHATAAGARQGSQSDDAVQFLFSSGNLESGLIEMYGIANS